MVDATRNIVTCKSPRRTKKYSIIIPGAGLGLRMISQGAKPLIKLTDDKTILSRQIGLIDNIFNKYEIILVTGFQADRFKKIQHQYLKVVQNPNFSTTNVLYSIKLGIENASTQNIVILYGDLVFNKEALNVPFDKDPLLVICNTMKEDEIGCTVTHGYLAHMFYGLPDKWAQILYLADDSLRKFKNILDNPQYHNKFGFEAINTLIDSGVQIRTIKPKRAKIIDVDTTKDLCEARKIK